MANSALNRRISTMRQSFFDEGILGEQFIHVERLGDDDPHFLERVLTTYFRESTQSIATLQNALRSPSCNPSALERPLHKFKGASASIGAIKVSNQIDDAIHGCRDEDVDRVKAAVRRIHNEYTILRRKFEQYFQVSLSIYLNIHLFLYIYI
ncbi:histidine-containing phosphotransfer protein 4-like [Cucurbita pepo subsp. pepo]|uniref:histidine-containing phosphotransfer protein 4-like n=1 Tax=Cucurbita pepo subsp. pepo TaxID=3664 RepID=UPI000C9D7F7D|nr:histidine-containing phosphotransfer protein 4-like [Cucurbita pepo subsp. pepo]